MKFTGIIARKECRRRGKVEHMKGIQRRVVSTKEAENSSAENARVKYCCFLQLRINKVIFSSFFSSGFLFLLCGRIPVSFEKGVFPVCF